MECPICLDPIIGPVVTVNCCNKQFHVECYNKCMDVKKECPMCRHVIIPINYPELPGPDYTGHMNRIVTIVFTVVLCVTFGSFVFYESSFR